MIKKIFIGLSLLILLTGCGKNSKKSDESIEIYNKASDNISNSNTKSNLKEGANEEKNPYQDIYKQIEGVKFYNSGGSAIESIYFYKDGYFDGALKTGNGYEVGQSFYNGKFDIVEKIDDTSYRLKLVRFDYDVKIGDKINKDIDGNNFEITNIKTLVFKDKSENYILHLGQTKTSSLNDNIITGMKVSGDNFGEDTIGLFLLTKEKSDQESFAMVEFKK